METLFYSTGKVARELGVSQEQVRALCSSAAIEAESTPGGQWRIPREQLERLKRDGLPPLARSMPGNGPHLKSVSASPAPGLVAAPSPDVVAVHEEADISAQQVEIRQNKIEGLKLHKEAVVLGDFFRGRRLKREAAAAAEREADRRQQARAEREARRQTWFEQWQEYGLRTVPAEARNQVEIALFEAISRVLVRLEPQQDRAITQRLVDAGVEQVLGPWRRRREIEQIIQDAADQLPCQARNYCEPTQWQIRATQAARAAIHQLDQDASLPEIEAAARQAVELIAKEFQGRKAAEADAELRADVIRRGSLPRDLNEKGQALARAAIVKALGIMPQGSSYGELAKVRDSAIVPFARLVDAVQEQEAKTQREQIERARQERQAELQRQYKEQEQQAKIEQEQAEQARRESEVESQRRAKEREQFQAGLRLSSLRSWIFDELHRLEQQGQLDELGFNERWGLAGRLEQKLKPILIDRLLAHPDLSDDRLKKRVGRLAQDHLDSVLAA